MSAKNAITALSRVANSGAVATVQGALKNNHLAVVTRNQPNAKKLLDGAIQRASVQQAESQISYSHNPEQVGLNVRPHQGVSSSGSGMQLMDPSMHYSAYQNKIAHIYMPQKKHVHNHPYDKETGRNWVIDFDTDSTYKSPLMSWTSGTTDAFYSKGDNFQMIFPSAETAARWCKMMGWGYTVQYPKYKYHTTKNYVENFKYKGEPKPAVEYD